MPWRKMAMRKDPIRPNEERTVGTKEDRETIREPKWVTKQRRGQLKVRKPSK